MFYGEVVRALNKARVKYIVVGGVAVVLYGYPRFTSDLDLIVYLEEKNLSKMYDALAQIDYFPKVPVTKEQFMDAGQRARWKKEKGMIVFSFVKSKPPFHMVDMFVDEPKPFERMYQKRKVVSVKGINVPLVSVDDLIFLKKKALRGKDCDDIVQLKVIKKRDGL